MSTSSINPLSSNYLQSILANALQDAGTTTNKATNSVGGTDVPSLTQPPDNSHLSPFAQLLSSLQGLQQSDPSKYQQVTQQVAASLQAAAQVAQSQGNTAGASKLSQLATDFTSASQSGQLPNIQDLAQATGAGHHHHHGYYTSGDSDGGSNSSSSSSANSLASAQNQQFNPLAIILNALTGSGISTTNS